MTSSALPPLPNLLRRLWRQLDRRRHSQVVLLLALMLIAALTEVFSLGAVLPFIGVLIAPDKVFRYPVVHQLADLYHLQAGEALLLPLTVIFIVSAALAGGIRLLLLWANTRLTVTVGSELATQTLRRTLYQPYAMHAASNSSAVINAIILKSHYVVNGVLMPTLLLIGSSILLLAIIAILVAIDAWVALIAATVIGSSYGVMTRLTKKRLKHNSEVITLSSDQELKILQESLGGIRDVLLDGTQSLYCHLFSRADLQVRYSQCSSAFIAGMPRFVMEAFGMGLIAIVAYVLSKRPDGMATALPILGTLALGAQRLLPALQQLYSAWANIVGHWAALDETLNLLEQPIPDEAVQPGPPPLEFHHEIRFDNVIFQYEPDAPRVLNRINLVIPKGARIGIVGSTGSGKSTLLDLLVGLLDPTEGQILVDGQRISGNRRRAWQRAVAHVPQSIYLADATVAENIAFGVVPDEIDMDRVRQSAKQAQITDYIESGSKGYGTLVGERGVRLSGGQRQRIGIARALYKQARVLIFDEATSALDSATEKAVIDAIESIDRDVTIVMIAHRLTTVQRCDTIIELECGRVVAQGAYYDLLASRPNFRHLAGVNR